MNYPMSWGRRKEIFLETIVFRTPELYFWTELVYSGYRAAVIFN